MIRWRILIAITAVLVSTIATAGPPSIAASTPAAQAIAAPPIERVTTIGASATAGFGVYFWRFEGDRRVRDSTDLARMIRSASDDQVVVSNLGSGQFFMNPEGMGTLAVDRAMKQAPDLVVAIDFLFWFVYGTVGPEARRMSTHEERLAMLERGLDVLDRLVEAGIPVVVGDIPDMSKAGSTILMKGQVPPEKTRIAANRRIAAWLAERPTARFLSLARLQRLLAGDEAIEIEGGVVPESERTWLLQRDRLHPTVGGLAVIVNQLFAMLAEDGELGPRVPTHETGYGDQVERITGLPEMRLQDPMERAYQREVDAALGKEGEADADPPRSEDE